MTEEQIEELQGLDYGHDGIEGGAAELALMRRALMERKVLYDALRSVIVMVPQHHAWQRTLYDSALAALSFALEKAE